MMEFKETLEVLVILLAIIGPPVGFIYNKKRKLKAYYEIIWKKSSSLKPHEILGTRGYPKYGFRKYYFQRREDELVRERIKNNDNVLIVGNPLSGKTRSIYQTLITSDEPYDVIVPKLRDINLEDFQIPYHFRFWRKEILVLDDMDKFVQKQNFRQLFQEFRKRNTIIIASCRTGTEYDILCREMGNEFSIFGKYIDIGEISDIEGHEITGEIGISFPFRFDGNIGSLFLGLDAMTIKFNQCNELEKGILRSIKRLYYAGIYEGREIFSKKRIKCVCEIVEEISRQEYEWKGLFRTLKNNGFIEMVDGDKIRVEEAYLELVITDETLVNRLSVLKEMMSLFSGDGEALVNIGNKACHMGVAEDERVGYIEIAIKAFNKALIIYNLKDFPTAYAMTQNSLGIAYITLAEVEDKAKNCRKAIEALEKALIVYNLKDFPMDYAATQNNLGIAYRILAEVEDKAQNCRNAIEACEKALKVYNPKKFQMQHAATQNNLGMAYITLAEVEDKAQNCRKAIKACEKALKVYNLEKFPKKFPEKYIKTQNNLGIAYIKLAEVENKAQNCRKAIKALEKALEVRTLKNFPKKYAATLINIGAAYKTLAEVENKAQNCRKAIKALEKALEVCNKDEFPDTHRLAKSNLIVVTKFCSEEQMQR